MFVVEEVEEREGKCGSEVSPSPASLFELHVHLLHFHLESIFGVKGRC